MDDGNLLGNPEKLLKAWDILSTELPKIGLPSFIKVWKGYIPKSNISKFLYLEK